MPLRTDLKDPEVARNKFAAALARWIRASSVSAMSRTVELSDLARGLVSYRGSMSTLRSRRGLSLLLRGALAAAVLVAVGFVIAGLIPGSSQRLSHSAAGWTVVEVILELVACTAYALLFHGVFSHGAFRVGYIRSAQIAIGELGAFVVVPTGAGGPALRLWALLRGGMPFRIIVVRSVVHAVAFNLPYVLAAIVLGTSVAIGVGPGHAPLAVALAPLGVVIGALLLAMAATRLAHRRQPGPETRWPHKRWRRVGREVVEAIPAGLRELPVRLREPSPVLGAIGYWAGDCAVLIVAFHAAHGSAPVTVIVLAYMLGQLGNALPLPGGVGGIEPIMLGVLTSSGVNVGLGAAAIVLYRFVSLGIQAAAGAVAVTTLTTAIQHSPRTRHRAPPLRQTPGRWRSHGLRSACSLGCRTLLQHDASRARVTCRGRCCRGRCCRGRCCRGRCAGAAGARSLAASAAIHRSRVRPEESYRPSKSPTSAMGPMLAPDSSHGGRRSGTPPGILPAPNGQGNGMPARVFSCLLAVVAIALIGASSAPAAAIPGKHSQAIGTGGAVVSDSALGHRGGPGRPAARWQRGRRRGRGRRRRSASPTRTSPGSAAAATSSTTTRARTGSTRSTGARRRRRPRPRTCSSIPSTGKPLPFPTAVTSGLSVGVPGTLMTWQRALQRWGRFSLAADLRAGRAGGEIRVSSSTPTSREETQGERGAGSPSSARPARCSCPRGSCPRSARRLRNPDLARTYGQIGRHGVGALLRRLDRARRRGDGAPPAAGPRRDAGRRDRA